MRNGVPPSDQTLLECIQLVHVIGRQLEGEHIKVGFDSVRVHTLRQRDITLLQAPASHMLRDPDIPARGEGEIAGMDQQGAKARIYTVLRPPTKRKGKTHIQTQAKQFEGPTKLCGGAQKYIGGSGVT
jgi:hypothetical protein